MIEIPDPPTQTACASCAQPILWLYSPRTSAWVAFVPAGPDHAIRPHPCRTSGAPVTWRDTPHPSQPNEEYRAAKERLRERTEPTENAGEAS